MNIFKSKENWATPLKSIIEKPSRLTKHDHTLMEMAKKMKSIGVEGYSSYLASNRGHMYDNDYVFKSNKGLWSFINDNKMKLGRLSDVRFYLDVECIDSLVNQNEKLELVSDSLSIHQVLFNMGFDYRRTQEDFRSESMSDEDLANVMSQVLGSERLGGFITYMKNDESRKDLIDMRNAFNSYSETHLFHYNESNSNLYSKYWVAVKVSDSDAKAFCETSEFKHRRDPFTPLSDEMDFEGFVFCLDNTTRKFFIPNGCVFGSTVKKALK